VREEAREKFWQRKRGAMKEPRRLYHEFMRTGGARADGSMMLVSPHLSMIKRYLPWFPPLALWHAWRMSVHAKRASQNITLKSPNDLDVLARALLKAPWPWRDLRRARECIEWAWSLRDLGGVKDTPVHTWALLAITYAEINQAQGKHGATREFYSIATNLLPDIEADMAPDRMKQYARVSGSCALYYLTHGDWPKGQSLMVRALKVSKEQSRDQYLALVRECRKLGYIWS